jgi:hypothetical protein
MAGYKVYGTSRRGALPGQRSFEILPLDVTSDELRYTAGVRAGRLRLLRRFAPGGLIDIGIRKDLRLDALTASR